MANIKITELNGITKKASDDVLAIVDVSANETKKIAVEDLLDKNIELIAVTDTEPAECSYGEKYYNTTDKLIYTAIANDTWSEDGEEPISGILYIVYNEQASYSWNGTDLISVGGGKEDIVISDTQPTDPDVKLWIDTGEIAQQVSEITNEYSTSTGLGYSANYTNNLHTYSTDEVRIGTWIDGKPLYRRTYQIPIVNATSSSNITVSNIDYIQIANAQVVITGSTTYTYYSPSQYESNSNRDKFYIEKNNSTNVATLTWLGSSKTGTIIYTVEYTKSTD